MSIGRSRQARPDEIAEVVIDKHCPHCGAVRGEGYVDRNGYVVPGGFDLGIDASGKVFGCLCFNILCGFSF